MTPGDPHNRSHLLRGLWQNRSDGLTRRNSRILPKHKKVEGMVAHPIGTQKGDELGYQCHAPRLDQNAVSGLIVGHGYDSVATREEQV